MRFAERQFCHFRPETMDGQIIFAHLIFGTDRRLQMVLD